MSCFNLCQIVTSSIKNIKYLRLGNNKKYYSATAPTVHESKQLTESAAITQLKVSSWVPEDEEEHSTQPDPHREADTSPGRLTG